MTSQFFQKIQSRYQQYKIQRREYAYSNFLLECNKGVATLEMAIHLGHRLMCQENLHSHFFGGGGDLLKTAQYLVFYALQFPHEYTNRKYLQTILNANQAKIIIDLFEKRISKRMPVEYLTHESWYLGNKFYVNPDVLVPRSLMNARFRDFLNNTIWENYRVLDLCTGSGCIGISLALLNKKIKVDLADISMPALQVANKNIDEYNLQDRVQCIQSDLFMNIQKKYDLIITNPPYVSKKDYLSAPPEFKNEPREALEAGSDGLLIIKKLILEAGKYLNPNGKLIAEVGVETAKKIKKQFPKIRFKWYKYKRLPENETTLNRFLDIIYGADCILECHAQDLRLQ